jgi:hypothetical protein
VSERANYAIVVHRSARIDDGAIPDDRIDTDDRTCQEHDAFAKSRTPQHAGPWMHYTSESDAGFTELGLDTLPGGVVAHRHHHGCLHLSACFQELRQVAGQDANAGNFAALKRRIRECDDLQAGRERSVRDDAPMPASANDDEADAAHAD